jgi:hypothetical protein
MSTEVLSKKYVGIPVSNHSSHVRRFNWPHLVVNFPWMTMKISLSLRPACTRLMPESTGGVVQDMVQKWLSLRDNVIIGSLLYHTCPDT